MKRSIADIKANIADLAAGMPPITIMEVCGTHTVNIRRFGLQMLLPENIRLISGPGCPVCVTAGADVAYALDIAAQHGVIFTCFGDMLRVPCGKRTLYSLYEEGYDIRMVESPLDALAIAQANPNRDTVFFGVGFETTAPLTATLIRSAREHGISNLSVLSAHKTMPAAITDLLDGGANVDALLCPGHVAALTGANAFNFVASTLKLPAAISGFTADDIMVAILYLTYLCRSKVPRCVNLYPRAVSAAGNALARSIVDDVFEPADATWRGLGVIAQSGLKIREAYRDFDALARFSPPRYTENEIPGCLCGSILRGEAIPSSCTNFGNACVPDHPLGACMVSSEGTCAAYYRYGGELY
ncbi:MAG: hydrogenase formation protein HypD [Clostridia bacterium]